MKLINKCLSIRPYLVNNKDMNNSIFFDYKPQNKVETAKKRLIMHRTMGKDSGLSIFDAAKLMDVIVFEQNNNSEEMIFSLSLN